LKGRPGVKKVLVENDEKMAAEAQRRKLEEEKGR